MNQMKSDSKFSMCPGVENVEIKDSIKRKPSKLREWPGLKRMDNIDCKLWYNSEENPKDMSKAVCPPCYSLTESMKQTKKGQIAEKYCYKYASENNASKILNTKNQKENI